jgi:thiamine kinase-like enzyme
MTVGGEARVMLSAEEKVRKLAIWQGPISVTALTGGVSNAGFVVGDATGKYVARVGEDYPCHHVSRTRELAVSQAAFAAGLSPQVIYAELGVSVLRFIAGQTYSEADVRANLLRCVALLQKCHAEMSPLITGPCGMFWVFQLLRDYTHTLTIAKHPRVPALKRLMTINTRMEQLQVSMPIVFGHHDLLAANFMDDGLRIWLIDWEYGNFGTAMFDLANLASNNSLTAQDEDVMLTQYFGKLPGAKFVKAYDAMKVAAALREALWGMVSEVHLKAPGVDYVAYATFYLDRFETIHTAFEEKYGIS